MLVIDDEAAMRNLLRDFLTSQGFSVECYASPEEAIKALKKTIDLPAAIISDVRMHPVDGIAFLKITKREFPTLPVILFTGEGNSDEKNTALKIGAANYLYKPFLLSNLMDSINQVVPPAGTRRK